MALTNLRLLLDVFGPPYPFSCIQNPIQSSTTKSQPFISQPSQSNGHRIAAAPIKHPHHHPWQGIGSLSSSTSTLSLGLLVRVASLSPLASLCLECERERGIPCESKKRVLSARERAIVSSLLHRNSPTPSHVPPLSLP